MPDPPNRRLDRGTRRPGDHCQAEGILIERERITADQAFQALRRASQHLNIKLREVAKYVVETGEIPSNWDR